MSALRVFYEGREVDMETALKMERDGLAHLVRAASASIPERLGGGADPWFEMEPGPSNTWIENHPTPAPSLLAAPVPVVDSLPPTTDRSGLTEGTK